MNTTFFDLLEEAPDAGTLRQRVRGLTACVGPWSAGAMHGGPPSALLVRACERVGGVGSASAGSDGPVAGEPVAGGPVAGGLVAVRAAVDFLGPVPVGDVEVVARVLRPGRRVALTEARLVAGGRDVLVVRTWLLSVADPPVSLPDDVAALDGATAALPAPADCPPVTGDRWDFPYGRAVEWRAVRGMQGLGDATVWARPRLPLLVGERPSGLQRAVLVADSSSGVSAGLDWDRWQFVNVDLTVHLARPLVGDWIGMEAHSRYAPAGTGLARATLHDERGVVGAGAQSLVVAPMHR